MSTTYWKSRVENIRASVTMRQIIDHFHVPSQSPGVVTQVHCPFHGNDSHPSARIYESNTMYCFYCTKTWDVIDFVKDFNKISFNAACSYLEETFGITKPDVATLLEKNKESFKDYLIKEEIKKKEKSFDSDLTKINNVLIKNRDRYSLSDYVKFFSYYDKLYSKYKSESYSDDFEIQNNLENLYKEIKRNL